MQTKYMQPRDTRTEYNAPAGRFRGGKLVPVACQIMRESESGVINQTIALELDAVAGRLLSQINAEVHVVYVPALAVDKLKNPTLEGAGIGEIFREKLLQGVVFDLENDNIISQKCNIIPRSIAGVKKVNEIVRLGHNCAVNYLRRQRHIKATLLTSASAVVTPALLSQNVLEMMNGVLDPEDRVNGKVNLNLGGDALVKGLLINKNVDYGGTNYNPENATSVYGFESGNPVQQARTGWSVDDGIAPVGSVMLAVEQDPNNPDMPRITAEFPSNNGAGISLKDFYTAERMDDLTRQMRATIDANPEYGEELVTRMAHGLSVETGRECFTMYHKTGPIKNWIARAMDGANLDTMQTETAGAISFTLPVPATEFGGCVYTFVSIKPDETLARQPHPVGSDVWTAINYLADELAVDPVQVSMRELDCDVAAVNEGDTALWVGPNHMLKRYATYGFTRDTDLTTVANKSAIWQVEIPLSVTADNVIYPETVDHYPFKDQTADVVQYNVQHTAAIRTPRIFGPTPVEELAQIETDNLFEDGV